MAGPCSVIGSEFNCGFRGREFDTGPILSWRLIMKYFMWTFSSSADSRRLLSVTSESMCQKYSLTA